VRGIVIKDSIYDNDTAFRKIIEYLKQEGYVERRDIVVFTAGLPLMAMGTTDTVNVMRVE
jgi:pyruvate kinase